MSINLEIRLKQLESLENYISSSRDKIQSILDCFKWSTEDVLKESCLIRCSVDQNHRVPVKSVDEHVAKCSLHKEGYDLNEQFLSEPIHDPVSSIFLDDHKKIEVLSNAHREVPNFKSAWNGQDPDPKTANRSLCTFSADERFALYSYSVANTLGPKELPEFNTIQTLSNNKELTYEELRMQERDAKRRRLKYKSVHTNRKSYTEVLHEVIDGQMDMYKDWLTGSSEIKEKQDIKIDTSPKVTSFKEYEQDEQKQSNCSSVTELSEHSQYESSRISSCSSGRNDGKDVSEYKYRHNSGYRGDYERKRSRHYEKYRERHKSYERYDSKEDKHRSYSRHSRDDSSSHHRYKRR